MSYVQQTQFVAPPPQLVGAPPQTFYMNQPPTQPVVMGGPSVVVVQPSQPAFVVTQVPPVTAGKRYNVWGEPHTYPAVECTCGRWLMWDAVCDVFLCCFPQKMHGNTATVSWCCQWLFYCMSLPLLFFLAVVSLNISYMDRL
jgi:hypothetical protein